MDVIDYYDWPTVIYIYDSYRGMYSYHHCETHHFKRCLFQFVFNYCNDCSTHIHMFVIVTHIHTVCVLYFQRQPFDDLRVAWAPSFPMSSSLRSRVWSRPNQCRKLFYIVLRLGICGIGVVSVFHYTYVMLIIKQCLIFIINLHSIMTYIKWYF